MTTPPATDHRQQAPADVAPELFVDDHSNDREGK